MRAAYGFYLLQVMATILIVVCTPLTLAWQLLIIASCFAYFKACRTGQAGIYVDCCLLYVVNKSMEAIFTAKSCMNT